MVDQQLADELERVADRPFLRLLGEYCKRRNGTHIKYSYLLRGARRHYENGDHEVDDLYCFEATKALAYS